MTVAPKRSAAHAGFASCFDIARHCSRAADSGRWPAMRAQRAKMMSRRDDARIAQDKRSAVLGNRAKMKTPLFFSSGLARLRRAKPEEKNRETGCGVAFTQGSGAACASLRRTSPRAIFVPPRQGLRRPQAVRTRLEDSNRKANERASLDAATALGLFFGRHGRRVGNLRRSASARKEDQAAFSTRSL
jgi:hypothetical protein